MDLSGIKEIKKGTCRNYKKPGHYIKDCKNRKKPKEQRPNQGS